MSLIKQDKEYVWHPYTQMQTAADPIGLVAAKGVYLYAEDGKKYIDAVSSWWVNIHGHSHPYIAKKVGEQALNMAHVIFAGFTHQPAVTLAKRLLDIVPGKQSKVFYSDDGSTAVEVAIKMCLQYWSNIGKPRKKIIAFKNAYHGDTFGAMSVSGRSSFTAPFEKLLFDVDFIDVPVPGKEKEAQQQLEGLIHKYKDEIAAFIFEPLIQGTAGMVMYSPEQLNWLIKTCKKHNILTIADEVMTGFGRTGKYFACEHIEEEPDIFCFSKGLTGGTMAMGITTCTQHIYDAFLSEDKMKTLFHGHSFTGNPLTCAAALASMDLLMDGSTLENIQRITARQKQFVLDVSGHSKVREARSTGTIAAIEWETEGKTSYFSNLRDNLYNYFLENGILLRPLGNIIYVMPPYCISDKELAFVHENIKIALNKF